MLLSPRLSARQLAELCERLSTEIGAGIDIRRVLHRMEAAAPPRARNQFRQLRDNVAAGESLAEAFIHAGDTFPRMFLEMVRVGEETGMLAEVLRRLGQHYRHQVEMRRTFLGLVAWPLIQLSIAIVVVGFLIAIMGVLASRNRGQPIDILGLGLIGANGLAIYVAIVACCVVAMATLLISFQRGAKWTRPLQRMMIVTPVVGGALQKICLAQLTWAMHVTLNVQMDLRRLIPLVLRATGNDYYTQRSEAIVAAVVAGQSLHESFAATGIFPESFVDALQVGEESGQLVETLGRLSGQYQEDAARAMKTLSVVAGVGVWLMVAGLIILMIFRIFGFYLGVLNEATSM